MKLEQVIAHKDGSVTHQVRGLPKALGASVVTLPCGVRAFTTEGFYYWVRGSDETRAARAIQSGFTTLYLETEPGCFVSAATFMTAARPNWIEDTKRADVPGYLARHNAKKITGECS